MPHTPEIQAIIEALHSPTEKHSIEKQKHFGIKATNAIGTKMPDVRKLAKTIGKNHAIAIQLWDTQIHEARILASMVAEPKHTTEKLIDQWIFEMDSWDICDQTCANLFSKIPAIENKIFQYANHPNEYVKRFSFAMIAVLAVHAKKENDAYFLSFLPLIEQQAGDDRNFVRKAVNWALRQIGKRNIYLQKQAIHCAENILSQQSKSAKWIATDALKELHSEAVKNRLQKIGK